MNKILGILFFSLLMVGFLNASSQLWVQQKQVPTYRYLLVLNPYKEYYETPLRSIRYDDICLIYDEIYCYGFFKYIAPNIFAHVDNINLDRKRYLNVQTGQCCDVEPV